MSVTNAAVEGNAVPVKAARKAKNVAASAKKAGAVAPSVPMMVTYCVAAFKDFLIADVTLQDAKALYDAARMGLRAELVRAYKVIPHGAAWDAFIAEVRAALVAAKVFPNVDEAGRCIRNQLTAEKIVGAGAKKGGKVAKGGRPEKTETGEATTMSDHQVAAKLVAVLHWVATMQGKYVGEDDILADLGDCAALCA